MMEVEITVDPLPLLGVCNLCLNEGAVKSMLLPYQFGDSEEMYSKMLLKCFAIDITLLEIGDTNHLICDSCVVRLRGCLQFRGRVEASVKALEANYLSGNIVTDKSCLLRIKQEIRSDDEEECGAKPQHGEGTQDSLPNEKIADIYIIANEKAHPAEVVEGPVISDDDEGTDYGDAADYDYDDDTMPNEESEPKNEEDLMITRSRTKNTGKKQDTNRIEIIIEPEFFPSKTDSEWKPCKYECRRCDATFNTFHSRMKHLAQKHNEELKKIKCKTCPESFITSGRLTSQVKKDHVKRKAHVKERSHQCQHCDMAFYTKHNLKMHMVRHEGERIHECNVCHKSYQRKKTLREHMRIHNNDRRFACPVCARAFTQKCNLKGHMKLHEKKADQDDKPSGLVIQM